MFFGDLSNFLFHLRQIPLTLLIPKHIGISRGDYFVIAISQSIPFFDLAGYAGQVPVVKDKLTRDLNLTHLIH